MTESDMGANSPAERRIRDILSRPVIGPQARLAALREAGLLPPADGYEVRTLELPDFETIPHVPAPLVHLDPNTPLDLGTGGFVEKTLGFKLTAGRSYIQATHCTFSTNPIGGNPSYIGLPSSPPDPDLMIFFDGRPVNQRCTAWLDMRVSSGEVLIAASDTDHYWGSGAGYPVSHDRTGGARVHVKIPATCTGLPAGWPVAGYGFLRISRAKDHPETRCYWYGVDLYLKP